MKKRMILKVLAITLILTLFLPQFALKVEAAVATPIAVFVESNNFTTDNVGGDSDNTLLWMKGHATVSGGSVLLTNGSSQAGSIVKRNQVMLQNGFSTYFQFNISGAGDGLAFVLYKSDVPKLGYGSARLGYGSAYSTSAITDSIIVEFDTYNNMNSPYVAETDPYNDPTPSGSGHSHVAIMLDGNINHLTQSDGGVAIQKEASITGSTIINAWVDYESGNGSDSTGTLTVTFGTGATKLASENKTISRIITVADTTVDGTPISGDDVFVGFTAASGVSINHQLIKWYFKDSYVSGGLDTISGSYSQAASIISVTTDNATDPSTALISAYGTDGSRIATTADIYLDNVLKLSNVNLLSTEEYVYTLEGNMLTAGTHRISAVAAGGVSNFIDFTVSPYWQEGISSTTDTWDNGGVISTALELAQLSYNVGNGRTYEGKTITLNNDIDLTGKEWKPIGNNTNINNFFRGTFDGNNHKVTGLEIGTLERPEEVLTHLGLFGSLGSTGTIKNLGLESVTIYSSNSNAIVGGLVGEAYGKITNSYVKAGAISAISNNYIGGLAGYKLGEAIVNSYAIGTYTGGTYIGGLVGRVTNANILNSYAVATITGGTTVGGLVGTNSTGAITYGYYNNDNANGVGVVGSGTMDVTPMPAENMKNSAFITELNSNLDTIADKTLYLWQTVSSDYPQYSNTLWLPTPVVEDFTITGLTSKTYNSAEQSVSIVPISGNSNGTITIYYNGTSTPPTNAGSYPVTFDVATTTDYFGVSGLEGGTLVIEKATLNATITPNNKPYDGNTTATISNVSYSGIFGGDDVSISGGSLTFEDASIGSNKAVTVSGYVLDGSNKENYTLGTITVNNANISTLVPAITQAPTIENGTFIYGTQLSALTWNNSPTSNEEGSFAWTNPTDVPTVGTDTAQWTFTPNDSVNYTTVTGTITITVEPKELTVSGLTVSDKTYDGTTTTQLNGTATIDGVIGSDVVELTTGTAAFEDANAGNSKSVTFSGYGITGANAGNYTLSMPNTTASIAKKTLTAKAEDKIIYIGNSLPTYTVIVTGFVNDEDSLAADYNAPTVACSATDSNAENTYPINASNGSALNYDFLYESGTLTISGLLPSTITFDSAAITKTYGDASFMNIATKTGSANPVTYTSSNIETAIVDTSTGEVAIVGSGQTVIAATVTLDDVYAPAMGSYMLTVSKIALTITDPIVTTTKPYDGTAIAAVVAGTSTGFIGSDESDVTVIANADYDNASAGVDKTITVRYTLMGGKAGNYSEPVNYTTKGIITIVPTLTPNEEETVDSIVNDEDENVRTETTRTETVRTETIKTETVNIIVNGKVENAGTETKSTEAENSVVTVTLNNSVVQDKIEEASQNNPSGMDNAIQVMIADVASTIAKVELTGEIIKKLDTYNFDVSVMRNNIEYVIPAQQFSITNVASELGVAETDLEAIKVEVQITKVDDDLVDKYTQLVKTNGAEIIFPPVRFEIVAKVSNSDGTKSEAKISTFSNYVERILEIPTGVDTSKPITGIVFNSDGTYSHVPTEVFIKNDKWYAKISSLTNSDYSIVSNPVEVSVASNHWSQVAVNDMASRLIIGNYSTFVLDAAITRGEFTEYMVKALGIHQEEPLLETKFTDVDQTNEHALAIQIAYDYGIIKGYSDGTFKPNAFITREEAMAMYSKPMEITNIIGNDSERYLNYSDHSQISNWALPTVQKVLSGHMFDGITQTTLSPKGILTYGQAAQAIKNLLVESRLINK